MGYDFIRELEINNEILGQLKDIKVIFDVGARDDFNYYEVKPKAKHHLFEPNLDFVSALRVKVGERKNVWLNAFGLGDVPGEIGYNDGIQAVSGGSHGIFEGNRKVTVKTLDWYVKEHKIKQIDFFKTDTEGHDLNILLSGKGILKNIKYIQFEHYNDVPSFRELLEPDFEIIEVGWRNVLCMNKAFVNEQERERIKSWLLSKGYVKDM